MSALNRNASDKAVRLDQAYKAFFRQMAQPSNLPLRELMQKFQAASFHAEQQAIFTFREFHMTPTFQSNYNPPKE
nr:MAG TPA: hypothetical protein [Caudoviricetes sp.]